MRLSRAATAAVQPRSANAAKLTLRIIEAFLANWGWKHRQPGDGDNAAGCARRSGRQAPSCGAVRAWRAGAARALVEAVRRGHRLEAGDSAPDAVRARSRRGAAAARPQRSAAAPDGRREAAADRGLAQAPEPGPCASRGSALAATLNTSSINATIDDRRNKDRYRGPQRDLARRPGRGPRPSARSRPARRCP